MRNLLLFFLLLLVIVVMTVALGWREGLIVAAAVPALSREGEARLARAMAATFTFDDEMDFAEAVAKRDALLALV